MKRKNFYTNSEEEKEIKEDIYDKTINIYDHQDEEEDIYDKTVGILEANNYFSNKKEEKTEEKDIYDKTVGMFETSTKNNIEEEEKDTPEQYEEDYLDKTIGIFSNYQEEEKEEIKIEENNSNYDIIKKIEITRKELEEDNEVLIDIGTEEKLSLEIPKNTKDKKKIILKGLGNKNTENGKKGDLIVEVTIKEEKDNNIEFNKNKIDYDYILFVGQNESLKDTQKILVIENNKKIIVPIEEDLDNYSIFDLKYKNDIKKVLLVKINDKQEANKLNNKYYQTKVSLKKDETYKIIKYQKKEIPLKVPKSDKKSYLYLEKDEDNDLYFKVLIQEKGLNRLIINIGLYILVVLLSLVGFFLFKVIGLVIFLIVGIILRDVIEKKIS